MTDFKTAHSLILPDEATTSALGRALAKVLASGDTLLLQGTLGAGKTTLARAIIQSALGPDLAEDVPSPTYTLVQTYDTLRGPIWHCDLYRISHADEVVELGLSEAFETAICLIEWPDRLGDHRPVRHLACHLDDLGNGRRLTLDPVGHGWAAVADVLGEFAS